MTFSKKIIAVIAASTLVVACDSDSSDASKEPTALETLAIECVDVAKATDTVATGELTLDLVGTYVSGNEFDTASAEVVSYDGCSDRIYVVNAEDQTVDVLAMDSMGVPSKENSIDLSAAATNANIEIGDANSVSAKQGLVAVAIQNDDKQEDGIIALYRSDTLALINTYEAGALPDMVALSEDARYVLSANEGEPNDEYTVDPIGSVTIVNLENGFTDQEAVVEQVTFTRDVVSSDVRLGGPNQSLTDLEPEYLALSADGKTAWVALQENNALAIIDVENAAVTSVTSMGSKAWDLASGNQLDASNKDNGPGIFNSYEQLVGLYMPDTIVSIEIDGATYILSANEGDGREYIFETTQDICEAGGYEWDGDDFTDTPEFSTEEDDCITFIDEARGKDIYDVVDAAHPLKDALDSNDELKRLKFVTDADSYAATDELVAFGGRSFSIWNESAELVYDSGDIIGKKAHADDVLNFNSTNDSNTSGDDRSDDKGTEPEAIEAAWIGDRAFAFVGLERQGGVMVFDITDPTAPVYQSYLNNRNYNEDVCTVVDDGDCDSDTYNESAGDLGPESIDYFTREGKHFIAVGNEVSGTTSVYEIMFN